MAKLLCLMLINCWSLTASQQMRQVKIGISVVSAWYKKFPSVPACL